MSLIKLDYAVLAILVHCPSSGYDITARLRDIWKTTHSRIYPVLAKLEKMGYVEFTKVGQDNKPDKKIYKITESGVDVLKNWVASETSQPVRKDEGLLKIMCLHLLDKGYVEHLIADRIECIEKERKKFNSIFTDIKKYSGGKVFDSESKYFFAHVVSEATEFMLFVETAWCQWVRELYSSKNAGNFYEHKFVDYLTNYYKNCERTKSNKNAGGGD